ncbi:MAG: hypothetical protein L7S45_04865 [Luminiphilus sp.]|nr:hypothetical protein [Luminiphilus sp.]
MLLRSLFVSLALLVSSSLSAQTLTQFENGQVAGADALNENFERLRSGPDFYQSYSYYQNHLKNVEVGCSLDPTTFDRIWNDTLHLDRVRYSITGACNAPALVTDESGVVSGTLPNVNGGRFIQIIGRHAQCGAEGNFSQLVMGSDALVMNYGGSLLLTCIELVNSTSIQVYANSYARVQAVTSAADSTLDLYSFDGGILRLLNWAPDETPVSIRDIQSVNGGIVRFMNGHWDIERLRAWSSHIRVSPGVEGNVVYYFTAGSTAELDSLDFIIDTMVLDFGSNARAKCGAFDEANVCVSRTITTWKHTETPFYTTTSISLEKLEAERFSRRSSLCGADRSNLIVKRGDTFSRH